MDKKLQDLHIHNIKTGKLSVYRELEILKIDFTDENIFIHADKHDNEHLTIIIPKMYNAFTID